MLYTASFSATLGSSGAISRKTTHNVHGRLGSSGAIYKRIPRDLAASLGFTSRINKKIPKDLSATLTLGAGSTSLVDGGHSSSSYSIFYDGGTSASIYSSGLDGGTASLIFSLIASGLGKLTKRTYRATLSSAGAISKQTSRVMRATLTMSSKATRFVTRTWNASMGFVSRRVIGTTQTGSLGFTGSLSRQINKLFKASLTPTATFGGGGPSVSRIMGHLWFDSDDNEYIADMPDWQFDIDESDEGPDILRIHVVEMTPQPGCNKPDPDWLQDQAFDSEWIDEDDPDDD